MSYRPHSRPPISVWARLAAFFSFFAVLSALLAPISLLAEEVRTGKLGGLCSASMASSGNPESGSGDAPSGSHCNWCSSTALALPPQPIFAIPYSPDFQLVSVDVSTIRAASIPGLPFSRGPPAI